MEQYPDNRNITVLSPISDPPVVAKYSEVGCYPLYYVTADNGVLSADSVQENLELCCDEDDPHWYVVGCEPNWENEKLTCDHTGEKIESAYGGTDDD